MWPETERYGDGAPNTNQQDFARPVTCVRCACEYASGWDFVCVMREPCGVYCCVRRIDAQWWMMTTSVFYLCRCLWRCVAFASPTSSKSISNYRTTYVGTLRKRLNVSSSRRLLFPSCGENTKRTHERDLWCSLLSAASLKFQNAPRHLKSRFVFRVSSPLLLRLHSFHLLIDLVLTYSTLQSARTIGAYVLVCPQPHSTETMMMKMVISNALFNFLKGRYNDVLHRS